MLNKTPKLFSYKMLNIVLLGGENTLLESPQPVMLRFLTCTVLRNPFWWDLGEINVVFEKESR